MQLVISETQFFAKKSPPLDNCFLKMILARESFSKNNCPRAKQTFCSDFVELGLAQKYLIYFWQKNGRLFVVILSDFGLFFNCSVLRAEKDF